MKRDKFEYLVASTFKTLGGVFDPPLESVLNDRGAEGWELLQLDHRTCEAVLIFKRTKG